MRTILGIVALLAVLAKGPAAAAQGVAQPPDQIPAQPGPPRQAAGLVTPSPRESPLQIARVLQPPSVEDYVRGVPGEAGTRVTGFRQRAPQDGQAVTDETAAYLSYDESNLYVVFVCKGDPRRVRAHLAKREDIDLDDTVTVYLDTFHDRRRAYVFSTNPLGIQRDGVITAGQDPDYDFDTVWQSEGQVTDDGFVVRMAIPFKSLRFRTEPGQTWGIGLERLFVQTGEDAYWPYITDRIEGFVQQLAPISGPEDVTPLRRVQLNPYGSFTGARVLNRDVAAYQTTGVRRAGLDGKLILSNAFAWDLTLNPDFGQVESDDPQVLVNQRFAAYFPEKRPFFLENSALFQTPDTLFFSRHVADPQYAGRLTGKAAGWAVGALLSDDRAAGQQAPTDTAAGSRAVLGVLRVQREIGQESTIGALATTRYLGSASNDVVAADTRVKLSPNWVFTGQVAASFDRLADGAHINGSETLASLSRAGRHFAFSSSYLDRSPEFDASLGFIQRVDIRQVSGSGGYVWRPGRGFVLAYGPSAKASVNWNHLGTRRQDWSGQMEWSVSMKGASEIAVSRAEYEELIQLQYLREHSTLVSFHTSPAHWLSLFGSYNQGAAANYSTPAGVLPFVGEARDGSAGFTVRPSLRFRLDEQYLVSKLAAGAASPAGVQGDIYLNHITRTKLSYQLTRPLSVRVILDYNRLSANPALVTRQVGQHVTGDLLVTYLVHPGTALYVGYNDQYDNLAFEATTPPSLVMTGFPRLSTGRQFYIRMSYLIR